MKKNPLYIKVLENLIFAQNFRKDHFSAKTKEDQISNKNRERFAKIYFVQKFMKTDISLKHEEKKNQLYDQR